MAIERPVSDDGGAASYDVIRARGQAVHVDEGEAFENTVIDVSTGESVFLRVTGSDTVIRNVGFAGRYRGDRFPISIDAGPGDVLVDTVYLGDGATRDGARSVHGPGAILLHRDNEADVTFRRCNVQGFPNNGFHCSNTAGGPGSVRFDSCFGKNNGVATFRCASGDDRIENCVAYTDDTDYGPGDDDYLETNGRPVWVWNGGTVTIRDSHFAGGRYPNAVVAGANDAPGRISFESGGYRGEIQRATGSTVDVGAAVSDDPDLSVPAGVPTSAEAAASSAAVRPSCSPDGAAVARLPHAVAFDGTEAEGPSSYSFETTGPVAAARRDASVGEREVVRDGPIRGVVGDAVDTYRFDGAVESLGVRGDASVSVEHHVSDGTAGGGPVQW